MEQNTDTMPDLPPVSILMLNYNGQAHLKEFFASVYELNYPEGKYEVVVVDNNSTDGSPDWLEQNYPRVKLIRLGKNTGFAGGNNIGAKYCQGEFIALVNNDTMLDKNWLIELVSPAMKDPGAIYCGKTLSYFKRDCIVYGGGVLFAWGYPCNLETYIKDGAGNPAVSLTLFPDGCETLISKKLYSELEGFEERYFCYGEDVELGWKAWLKGYRVYYIPTARIYHKVRGTMGRASTIVWYLIWKNQLRNLIKFVEFKNLVIELPEFTIFTMGFYVAVLCVQERQFSSILLIIKAYWETLLELPSLIKERAGVQKTRKITDKELKRLHLILTLKESLHESFSSYARRRAYYRE